MPHNINKNMKPLTHEFIEGTRHGLDIARNQAKIVHDVDDAGVVHYRIDWTIAEMEYVGHVLDAEVGTLDRDS